MKNEQELALRLILSGVGTKTAVTRSKSCDYSVYVLSVQLRSALHSTVHAKANLLSKSCCQIPDFKRCTFAVRKYI